MNQKKKSEYVSYGPSMSRSVGHSTSEGISFSIGSAEGYSVHTYSPSNDHLYNDLINALDRFISEIPSQEKNEFEDDVMRLRDRIRKRRRIDNYG